MARPTTTNCLDSYYLSQSACFKQLSTHDQQALMVYFKAAELAALGGTNYLAALSTTLVTDAACAYNKLNPSQYVLAELVIEQGNANDAGAATSTDIQVLSGLIKCLKNQNETMLKAMDLVLTCKLGRHAALPQVNL